MQSALAQKAFSMYSLYPLIGKYINGTTASGLFEASLVTKKWVEKSYFFQPHI